MRDLAVLFIHLIATVARLLGRRGARSVVAESLLLKHQLLILNRSRTRAPNLRPIDRVIAGLCTGLMRPTRLLRSAIVLKPATIMAPPRIGEAQVSTSVLSAAPWKAGTQRACPRADHCHRRDEAPESAIRLPADRPTALLIFGVEIDKDVVRRVLARRYRPEPGSQGPSWLTFLGHSKDRLWSVELFRCESLILRTHWVLVVMDQFTRTIVGFGVQAGALDGPAVCSMFNHAIAGARARPRHLSSDHDPLFEFHRWKANLRILDLTEIKTVPEVPLSHPLKNDWSARYETPPVHSDTTPCEPVLRHQPHPKVPAGAL